MTRSETINKTVLIAMIPYITQAHRKGMDGEAIDKLVKHEKRLRTAVERMTAVDEKPRLKLVAVK